MNKAVYDILQGRFNPREYTLLAEVRDAAGFHASRSADFIAVNLWPSRGLAIHGIELKSSRSDWLSELKKPAKQEAIFQYCDYFWLLTGGDGVAKMEEIPDAWGWLVIKGEKVHTMKEAPKLDPRPCSKTFLCALLKRASDKTDYVHRSEIQEEITKAQDEGKKFNEWEVTRIQKEIKSLKEAVKEFEDAAGIKLNLQYAFDLKGKGAAIQYLTNHGIPTIQKQLKDLGAVSKNLFDRISEGIKLFENETPHV